MKIEQVKKLKPIARLSYWIQERESIRLLREAGKPKPWTEDTILQTYRFCNVRRMDDTVSKWLLTNWYKPYFNHPNMLYAVALARFINKPESLRLITNQLFGVKTTPSFSQIKKILREHKAEGNTVFNSAYMVRGNLGVDKIDGVVDLNVKPLKDVIIETDSMALTHARIMLSYGIGSFMAGQIVADLRWAVAGNWLDKDYWAPIGPGSNRGMCRLYEERFNPPMKQEEFLTRFQYLIPTLCAVLPKSITSRLEAIDFQNTLCEYDKYERVLWGTGKPKQLFRSLR